MQPVVESLPLFPLSDVLFPKALLRLRIFESRYLDMVKECMRENKGFGVVANLNASDHAAIGTEAIVVDFSTLEDGLLGLKCRGHRRFQVLDTSARANGLIVADVQWWPPEPAQAIRSEHAALQTLMREMLRQEMIARELDVDIDQASELGFGLASILPLEVMYAQHLLEMQDPAERLGELSQWVQTKAAEFE